MITQGACLLVWLASHVAAGEELNPYVLPESAELNPYITAHERMQFLNPYRSEAVWPLPAGARKPPYPAANPYRSEPPSATAAEATSNAPALALPANPYRY